MNKTLFKTKAVTLVEMLVAISLFAIVFMTTASLDLFVRRNYSDTDRKTKLQNEISPTVEHMVKTFSSAVGDITEGGSRWPTNTTAASNGDRIWEIRVPDANFDPINLTGWHWSAYRYSPGSYAIWYYDTYGDENSPHDVIADKITGFDVLPGNDITHITLNLIARYDPTNTTGAPSPENPEARFSTDVQMRAVGAN